MFIETNVLIYCAKAVKCPTNTLRIIANFNDFYIVYCMKILYKFLQRGYIREPKRKIYDKLLEWKEKYSKDYALMIEGARRIGKSTIVEIFSKKITNRM